MANQQQSHRNQQHHHQQNQNSDQHHQNRQQSGHSEVQRREFLWRERVKLELQVQALLARAESLKQAWRALQQRKVDLQHQKPKLAAQMVLSGLVRSRSLPAERMFHYERERILQEEERLRQAIIFCQGDLAALQAQIEVIQLELSFLQ